MPWDVKHLRAVFHIRRTPNTGRKNQGTSVEYSRAITLGQQILFRSISYTLVQGGNLRIVVKSYLSLNLCGGFKVLRIGPSESSFEGKVVRKKLLRLGLSSELRGLDANRIVFCERARCQRSTSVVSCCLLRIRAREYVKGTSFFHVTNDDIEPFVEVERLEVDFVTAHQLVRRSGSRIVVLNEARRIGSTSSPWDCEIIFSGGSGRLSCVAGQEGRINDVAPGTVGNRTLDGVLRLEHCSRILRNI